MTACFQYHIAIRKFFTYVTIIAALKSTKRVCIKLTYLPLKNCTLNVFFRRRLSSLLQIYLVAHQRLTYNSLFHACQWFIEIDQTVKQKMGI